MQVVLASSNQHKAQEISAMLPNQFNLMTQGELGIESVPETGSTFIENALIKAKHAAKVADLPAIADDSGICVEALGGAPGIYSARYAGEGATDQQNLEKLLRELGDEPNRRAFFYCVLVFLETADDPTPIVAEASWHGQISLEPSGSSGFGYDPIFYLPDAELTAAEMAMADKNSLGHRGQALEKLKEKLLERYSA